MSTQLRGSALLGQVLDAYCRTSDPRWNLIAATLIRHLHEFVDEVELKPQEWMAAIQFLTQTGQACVGPRQEFILLSDVLGVSSAVDNLDNASSGGTESAVLGPFYVPDSDHVAAGTDLALTDEGERLLVQGRVLTSQGKPIAGALLDIWQTAPNKFYAVQDSQQPAMNCRGKLRADALGHFEFRTRKPVAYPVPIDGPVGELLRKSGREPMRPAHIHFIVSAPGYRAVTTQVFTHDDPYIDSDAVFGVKQSLLARYERNADPRLSVEWILRFDFVLDEEHA
jgi:protocatechuate 3,4-dioxygenase beta subunit